MCNFVPKITIGMKLKLLLPLLLFSLLTWAQDNTFQVAALNVDGMPRQVKALGMIDITLNPDAKEEAGAIAIGQKLLTMGYDVVALEEDFNYDAQIMAQVSSLYSSGTHRGGIDPAKAQYLNFVAQAPLFDTDGLNILYKGTCARVSDETFYKWTDHYGYTDDGADGLINKGFRYYTVTIHDSVEVDVYIVHMDAECSAGDLTARESNMQQVVRAILASNNRRPVLILGDTNCRYNRDRVKQVMIDQLNADPRFDCRDVWVEHCWDGQYPDFVSLGDASASISVHDPYYGFQHGEVVDKIFYINNIESPYYLQALYYLQDTSFVNEAGEPLADHWPVVTTFSYHKRPVLSQGTDRTPSQVAWEGQNPLNGGDYFVFHPYSGRFLSVVDGALQMTEDTVSYWTIAPSSSAMTMQTNGQYFYLNRTGTPGFYSAEPKLSTTSQTILMAASETSLSYGAYKLYRTKDTQRYLNYNGSDMTAAKSTSEQNDWVFITRSQFADSVSISRFDDMTVPFTPTPGHDALPGLQHPTSLQSASLEGHSAPQKVWINGCLYLRNEEQIWDVLGRKVR